MSSELYLILTERGIEEWEDETGQDFDELPEKEQERLKEHFYYDGYQGLIDRAEVLNEQEI